MTAILRPVPCNPFNTSGHLKSSCRNDQSDLRSAPSAERNSISLDAILHDKSPQASPLPVLTMFSAPVVCSDENVSPSLLTRKRVLPERSLSAGNPKTHLFEPFRGQLRPRNFTIQPLASKVQGERKDQTSNAEQEERFRQTRPVTSSASTRGQPDHDQPGRSGGTEEQKLVDVRLNTPDVCVSAPMKPHKHDRQWLENSIARTPSPDQHSVHAYLMQSSDRSSACVHGVKTASMSDFSMSVAPRARFGQSTATDVGGRSQVRSSLDSDRPITRASVDVSVPKCGKKRDRIIDEIVATERSYVADLKALVNLYSTLSASTTSVPSRMTAAIQRNVNRILHVHEKLLDRLSKMLLQSAARRWADTAVSTQSEFLREAHHQRLRKWDAAGPATDRRCTRSSMDSVIVVPVVRNSSGFIDIGEVTTIFKDVVSELYTYEEYCANYEVIKHELQRQMPQLWSPYEAGMESLASAIIPIVGRPAGAKKAMTVADLLIKPIQRITKYPLLLEDLLHETPVTDALDIHAELDVVLQSVREVAQTINMALDDRCTRLHVQRR